MTFEEHANYMIRFVESRLHGRTINRKLTNPERRLAHKLAEYLVANFEISGP